MTYPKRRGIYYLREDPEAGLYIWIRHRPVGEKGGRKRKFGRKLAPYFDRNGWKIPKHLTDRRLMEVRHGSERIPNAESHFYGRFSLVRRGRTWRASGASGPT